MHDVSLQLRPRVRACIQHFWDGSPAPPHGPEVSFGIEDSTLSVEVDAPFYRDPPPTAPPGSVPGLWEFEVVELFLLGRDRHYFELELGPHGHYLALRLHGVRRVLQQGLLVEFEATRGASRWTGRARVPRSYLPPDVSHFNAFAMHGLGSQRRHWAHRPTGGAAPDFHRLEAFAPWPLER